MNRQSKRHRRTVVLGLGALAVALALALTGCGKKPKQLDAPPGKEASGFPHTYPNPSVEAKPGQPAAGQSSSGLKFP